MDVMGVNASPGLADEGPVPLVFYATWFVSVWFVPFWLPLPRVGARRSVRVRWPWLGRLPGRGRRGKA